MSERGGGGHSVMIPLLVANTYKAITFDQPLGNVTSIDTMLLPSKLVKTNVTGLEEKLHIAFLEGKSDGLFKGHPASILPQLVECDFI